MVRHIDKDIIPSSIYNALPGESFDAIRYAAPLFIKEHAEPSKMLMDITRVYDIRTIILSV